MRFELSPFAPRRSHRRVPQEMGVGLARARGLQPHPSTFERSAAHGDNFGRAVWTPRAGAKPLHNIRFVQVPAVGSPMLSPAALDHALESAPFVDPPTIGLFTAPRRWALNPAQPATAPGLSHRRCCAKRVLAARLSLCRRTIAIPRPDRLLTLSGESGFLSGRDRHASDRIPEINSDSAAR